MVLVCGQGVHHCQRRRIKGHHLQPQEAHPVDLLVEGIEDYLIAHPVDHQVGCDASVLIAHPVDHQEVWHHKERRRADIEYL